MLADEAPPPPPAPEVEPVLAEDEPPIPAAVPELEPVHSDPRPPIPSEPEPVVAAGLEGGLDLDEGIEPRVQAFDQVVLEQPDMARIELDDGLYTTVAADGSLTVAGLDPAPLDEADLGLPPVATADGVISLEVTDLELPEPVDARELVSALEVTDLELPEPVDARELVSALEVADLELPDPIEVVVSATSLEVTDLELLGPGAEPSVLDLSSGLEVAWAVADGTGRDADVER